MITRKILHISTPLMGILMLSFSVPLAAQKNSSKAIVNYPVASGISAPLRVLAKLPATRNTDFTRQTQFIAFQSVRLLPLSTPWNRAVPRA